MNVHNAQPMQQFTLKTKETHTGYTKYTIQISELQTVHMLDKYMYTCMYDIIDKTYIHTYT